MVFGKQTVYGCIEKGDCQGYMKLLLGNFEKNRYGLSVAIDQQNWFDHMDALSKCMTENRNRSGEETGEWLGIYMDTCEKLKMFPKKERLMRYIKRCKEKKDGDSSDDKKENERREAMLPILKQYFEKFYPGEKIPL